MSPSRDEGASQLLLPECSLEIPKFSSVIICTHEIVKLPANVAASFNLKIKMALKGLFVQMGTQVEPNYNGRLFALLQNITDSTITLTPKDDDCRLLAIQFFFTSSFINPDENDFQAGIKIERIGQFIKSSPIKGTINNITSDMEKDIDELKERHEEFSKQVDETERKVETATKIVAEASTRIFQWKTILIGGTLFAGLGILVSVIAPIITKVVYDRMADERFETVNNALQDLSAKVDELSAPRPPAAGTQRPVAAATEEGPEASNARAERAEKALSTDTEPTGASGR